MNSFTDKENNFEDNKNDGVKLKELSTLIRRESLKTEFDISEEFGFASEHPLVGTNIAVSVFFLSVSFSFWLRFIFSGHLTF